uniref:Uncharacterized protein n=1 Tax=Arundo donax TaxID=35708 RepID=A0A0A9THS0_ARUDO
MIPAGGKEGPGFAATRRSPAHRR